MKAGWVRRSREFIEGLCARSVTGLLRVLPTSSSQILMGWVFAKVGPWLSVHRLARRNLAQTFPHWTPQRQEQCLRAMYKGWGHWVGSYPHIHRLDLTHWTLEGIEHISMPSILCSGHFHGFPMVTRLLKNAQISVAQLLRLASNPWAAKIMIQVQEYAGVDRVIDKNHQSSAHIVRALKEGCCVHMLIDHRLRVGGVRMPFLGRQAWIARGPVVLARRLHCPLVPVSVHVLGKNRGKVCLHPPLTVSTPQEELEVLEKLHSHIAQQIKDRPESWFWLHDRWRF